MVAVEQRHVEMLFQHPDAVGDPGPRDAQLLGGAGEALVAGRGLEEAQAVERWQEQQRYRTSGRGTSDNTRVCPCTPCAPAVRRRPVRAFDTRAGSASGADAITRSRTLAADRAMYGPTPTVTPRWSISTAMAMSGQEALHAASVGLRHRSATGSTATTRRHRLRGRSRSRAITARISASTRVAPTDRAARVPRDAAAMTVDARVAEVGTLTWRQRWHGEVPTASWHNLIMP